MARLHLAKKGMGNPPCRATPCKKDNVRERTPGHYPFWFFFKKNYKFRITLKAVLNHSPYRESTP